MRLFLGFIVNSFATIVSGRELRAVLGRGWIQL